MALWAEEPQTGHPVCLRLRHSTQRWLASPHTKHGRGPSPLLRPTPPGGIWPRYKEDSVASTSCATHNASFLPRLAWARFFACTGPDSALPHSTKEARASCSTTYDRTISCHSTRVRNYLPVRAMAERILVTSSLPNRLAAKIWA